MQTVERMLAEWANTYHYQSPTARGRVGSRREHRVDVVDSGDPPQICIHLQHRRIAPPPLPVPLSHRVGGIETHRWAMVESLPTVEVELWTTSIVPWQCGGVGLNVPSGDH